MSRELTEVEGLKYWIDVEVTLIHIGFYITWGILIGGKFWYLASLGIFISLIYIAKKGSKLPRNYLK